VIVVSQRVGLVYWAAIMILFAVEWLWVRPDPGWGAWLAGSSLTVLCALLIRHQIDLNAQLRAAQASLAEQARTAERNRIARELHDVIGHTLVVSLLHVQSARLAVEHDPADAARALAEAERLAGPGSTRRSPRGCWPSTGQRPPPVRRTRAARRAWTP
jgi:signal transduction histidine kinase